MALVYVCMKYKGGEGTVIIMLDNVMVSPGKEKAPAGPGKARRTRDKSLWAQRHWETDSSALRLY